MKMKWMMYNLAVLIVFIANIAIIAQQSAPPPAEIQEIIRKFAAAESANREARSKFYTYTQDYDLLTIGEAGSITGRYHRISDIVFDNAGNRFEKITFFPPSTLAGLTVMPEDLQDVGGAQVFALTTEELPKYHVDYVGKEKLDELDTYVFDVKPKEFIKGERYLQGRIWVDDRDLQIVKVKGQAVPEVKNQKFPRFESYRENIDDNYWFPTYIYSDDVLDFKNNPIRVRYIVKYRDYKKFVTGIKVIDEKESGNPDQPQEPESKTPGETGGKNPGTK
jgi:hypothetical protein